MSPEDVEGQASSTLGTRWGRCFSKGLFRTLGDASAAGFSCVSSPFRLRLRPGSAETGTLFEVGALELGRYGTAS